MRRTRTAGLVGLLTCILAVALILATSREPAPSARAPEGLVERGQEPAASLAAAEDATHPEEPTQERAAAPASAPEPVAREATARRAILSGRVLQNEAPLADCVVVIGGDRGAPPARCTTDSDGRFLAADLPPGTYTLAFFGATVPQPWTKRFLRVPAGELEPGSYLAEPFTAPTDFRFATVGAGRSFGVLIPLRVGAEGALDPPRLVLPPDADADADAQRAR